jgi:hypothetical protein
MPEMGNVSEPVRWPHSVGGSFQVDVRQREYSGF